MTVEPLVVANHSIGLLTRPALGVDAGVHHQAAGAEGQGLQVAELAERIAVIDAELVGELLGV